MKKHEKLLEIIGSIDERHVPEPKEVFNTESKGEEGQTAEMQLSSAYKKRGVPVKAIAFAASLAAAAVAFAVLLKNFPLPVDDPIEPVYTSNTTIEGIAAQPSGNPLDLIGYYIDEEGKYRVDYYDWEESDDFDLFRKYFFGSWDNAADIFNIFGKEYPLFVIDDSEKSLIMNDVNWRFTGFYKLSENTLAFAMNSNAEMLIFWMDINSPDIMYADLSNGGWLFTYNTFSKDYKPTVLTKTDAPVNPPEENFLSIYKLYEMSRDYGIDFNMLVDIEYYSNIYIGEDPYFLTENGWVWAKLLHDDWYQFYPVYLVSEAPDKLEFKTRIGNIIYEDSELDTEYTIEKIDGEWLRTVKIIKSDGSVTTLPPTNSSGEDSLAALELLDYYIDEDGHYQAGVDKWTETQDYDLFRKYFFGVWEGDFHNSTLSSENIPNRMVIDDSEKSTIATDPNIFFSGMFYRSEKGTLVFLIGSFSGASMYWTDTNNPGTLYAVDGGIGEHNWIVSYNDGYPEVYTLTKTDEPINEPENGYLSIYRFYELSRDYGISLDTLLNIEYDLLIDADYYPNFSYISENGKIYSTLYHDDKYQFFPVYLVSDTPDKLVFKTRLGNYYNDIMLDTMYTVEKSGYWWRRTVEITLPNGEIETLKNFYDEFSPPVLYNRLTWETKTEELPTLSVEPFCYYSVTSQAFSQLNSTDANPWQEEEIKTLPVFKDKYYGIDSMVQGGCTEEKELKRMAEAAAEILGLTVNEDETMVCITYGGLHVKEKEYTEDMGKYPMSVTAYCDGAKYGTELVRIMAYYNGEIYIRFGNAETIDDVADMGKDPEGYKLPEGIYWTDGAFTDENVNQNTYTLNYLISEFKDLLQFLNPQINMRTRNYSDGKNFSMSVQDAGGSFTEKLLNYNFSAADFYFNSYDNTELHSIHLQDTLSLLGEYAGDYPIISPEEAREILLSGKYARQYLESEYRWKGLEYKNIPIDEVENEVINESDIRGVSLVYEGITYDDQEYFQPYYRFYIESEPYYDEDEGENMIVQSYYYVPAVSEEYISGVDTSRKY